MHTLGEIIASFLTPAQFAQATNDPANFDPATSRWLCLTDPHHPPFDISTTRLGRLSGQSNAPSFVGMFLRGISAGRAPGDQQLDALQGHGHRLKENAASTAHNPATAPPHGLASGGYTHAVRDTAAEFVDIGQGAPRVDNETRPKNIAVHYYLRVNP